MRVRDHDAEPLAAETPARIVDPAPDPGELTPAGLAALQRTAGNEAVCRLLRSADGRMLQRETPDGGTPVTTDGGTRTAADAGARLTPSGSVGGDTLSTKVVYLAWTFDDGPSPATPGMEAATAGFTGTWYVGRDQLGHGETLKARLTELKRKQDVGAEIAIHAVHETQSHLSWFPPGYSTIEAAIADLKKFHALLTGAGLRVGMVRLPTGLVSEITRYLRLKGVAEAKADLLAPQIINGTLDRTKAGPDVLKVQDDFDLLQKELAGLGLTEWGGASGKDVSLMSWEAESSPKVPASAPKGTAQLADTAVAKATEVIAKTAKDGVVRSLVILAHDTPYGEPAAPYSRVPKVEQDVQAIEQVAIAKGVKLEYKTMSQLYPLRRGQPVPGPAAPSPADAGTDGGAAAVEDAGVAHSVGH